MSLALSTPPAIAESISPAAMRCASCAAAERLGAEGRRRGGAGGAGGRAGARRAGGGPGAAGALRVVGGRLGMQPRAERAFARQVPVARVLDHRTGRNL